MTDDAALVRLIATQIGEILDTIDRKDGWSARIYSQAAYMAGLGQLRRVMDETDVIAVMRQQADQSEALLIHAYRMTGEIFGQRDG